MRPGVKKFIIISTVLLGIWLGIRYLMGPVLPFLLGTGLALVAEPMTGFLCRRLRLPRSAAAGISVTAAFCFLTLLILLLCALIIRELGVIAGIMPDLEQTARSGLQTLSQWLLRLISRFSPGIRSILERNIQGFFSDGSALLDQTVRYILGLASAILTHVPDSALTLGTAVIASFMISSRLPRLREKAGSLIPKERREAALDWLKRTKSALTGWFLAQAKLSAVTWGLITLGFLLLRIPYAPLWALLVALVDAFPVLGTGTVLIPWSLICFLQGSTARGVGLAGLYALVALTRSVLEPKLVGRQLGLDPLVTLLALYAGYRLWGLGGMILAPLLTVTAVQLLPKREDRTA